MAQADATPSISRRRILSGALSSTALAATLAGVALPALAKPLAREEAEFEKLLSIFEGLWESYLPVHQRFADVVDDAIVRHAAHTVLEYEATTPRGRALKAAAAIVVETAGDHLGDDIRESIADLLFEIIKAGGVAMPDLWVVAAPAS